MLSMNESVYQHHQSKYSNKQGRKKKKKEEEEEEKEKKKQRERERERERERINIQAKYTFKSVSCYISEGGHVSCWYCSCDCT